MIFPEHLAAVGNVIKAHGINGEIAAMLDPGIDPDEIRCIVLMMDGIPVPFFIEQWRTRGSESVLLTLDGVTSEQKAKALAGKEIYVLREDLPERDPDDDGLYAADLIDWNLTADGVNIGRIIGFDDSTINLLLIVRTTEDKEIFIPLAEEFITGLDREKKVIEMTLPEGLLSL